MFDLIADPPLEPGEYSSYYLDTLAPAHPEALDAVKDALESHLLAIMNAHGYEVVRLTTSGVVGQLVAPPSGWLMLRATVTVIEFDVTVDAPAGGDDDRDDTGFDVEVD